MGQERDCTVVYDGTEYQGRALLETSDLIFRGPARLKIPFRQMTTVEARGGWLVIEFPPHQAAFDLGNAASKWAGKILHPPTRLDKLGISGGVRLRWVGAPDEDFKREATEAGAVFVRSNPDLTFVAVSHARNLDQVAGLPAPLWIVYPKGRTEIREADVLRAGRQAGLTDIKVASFSPLCTALKFVARGRQR